MSAGAARGTIIPAVGLKVTVSAKASWTGPRVRISAPSSGGGAAFAALADTMLIASRMPAAAVACRAREHSLVLGYVFMAVGSGTDPGWQELWLFIPILRELGLCCSLCPTAPGTH